MTQDKIVTYFMGTGVISSSNRSQYVLSGALGGALWEGLCKR